MSGAAALAAASEAADKALKTAKGVAELAKTLKEMKGSKQWGEFKITTMKYPSEMMKYTDHYKVDTKPIKMKPIHINFYTNATAGLLDLLDIVEIPAYRVTIDLRYKVRTVTHKKTKTKRQFIEGGFLTSKGTCGTNPVAYYFMSCKVTFTGNITLRPGEVAPSGTIQGTIDKGEGSMIKRVYIEVNGDKTPKVS